MQIEFIDLAALELDNAINYYETELSGLGQKFLEEILESAELISRFPQLFPQNSEHTRRVVLRKFPFNLIYTVLNNKIYIIAVAHQNRAPEYWVDRVKKI